MAGDSRSFGGEVPSRAHLVRGSGGLAGEVADLRADADDGFLAMESEVSGKAVAAAHLQLDVVATEGNTVVIAGDTYEFVTALGNGVAGGIEVVITDAATQLANIVAAINGTAAAAVASGAGVVKVRAEVYNTNFLRVEAAASPGQAALGGTKPTYALSETLTDTATWDHEELGRTGGDVGTKKTVHEIDVDATNLLADFDMVAPSTVISAQVLYVTDAAGVVDTTGKGASIILAVNAALNSVTVDLNGGVTDPVATDKVYLEITHQ